MASVIADPNGTRRICFSIGGKRPSIRMGSCSKRDAELVAGHVEQLVSVRKGLSSMPANTASWLKSCGPVIRAKLARVGLLDATVTATPRLKQWVEKYVADRDDLGKRTSIYLTAAGELLVEFFGAGRALNSITAADAAAYVRSLGKTSKGKKRKDNSIRRLAGRAKQFFNEAIKAELIEKNPFSGIATNVRPCRDRDHYVTKEEFDQLLAGCRHEEWTAILVLARFAGMRCPSETTALRWRDIDFVSKPGSMIVTNVKTSRTSGQSTRKIPLFPEVREALMRLPKGRPDDFVITQLRGENLRQELGRIAKRVGLKLWAKPFVNMRGTRATELLSQNFPEYLVSAWLGHDVEVSRAHYLQQTKESFEKAGGVKSGVTNAAEPESDFGWLNYFPSISGSWTSPTRVIIRKKYPRQESNL